MWLQRFNMSTANGILITFTRFAQTLLLSLVCLFHSSFIKRDSVCTTLVGLSGVDGGFCIVFVSLSDTNNISQEAKKVNFSSTCLHCRSFIIFHHSRRRGVVENPIVDSASIPIISLLALDSFLHFHRHHLAEMEKQVECR